MVMFELYLVDIVDEEGVVQMVEHRVLQNVLLQKLHRYKLEELFAQVPEVIQHQVLNELLYGRLDRVLLNQLLHVQVLLMVYVQGGQYLRVVQLEVVQHLLHFQRVLRFLIQDVQNVD